VHIQIAKEFTDNLANETMKAELSKVLSLDSWWTHFFFAARRLNLESLWSSYRRRRLHAELEQQLKSLGVPLPLSTPPTPIPTLTPIPMLTSEPAHIASEARPTQTQEVEGEGEEEASQLRKIAAGVIRRLPASSLREVWLPLGYVLDEIGEK
jgi:hypothetical protein